MEFSEDQQLAIAGAVDTMRGAPNYTYPNRLVGAAGTGKTQVLAKIAGEVDAVTLAPTNKACSVLRSRGVPAVTIHSQIYAPEEISLREDLAAAVEAMDNCEILEREGLEAKIAAIEERLEASPKGTRMKFSFRAGNSLRGRNVIIDEASMVGKRTLGDIMLSCPCHVLLVGDPGQLPPINQEDSLRAMPANWTLVTQHRTGEAKDLADLANVVRTEGPDAGMRHALQLYEKDPLGPVRVYPRGQSDMSRKFALMDATANGETIWLCHKNMTRLQINRAIRQKLGLETKSRHPVKSDRLVAYGKDGSDKGRWHNGSSAVVLAVEAEDVPITDGFTMTQSKGHTLILSIDGQQPESVNVAYSDFGETWSRDDKRTWQYGYCLTVHKAQGSEWDTVVVADDNKSKRGGNSDRRQWLYTALTRARKRVVWIR